MPLKSIDSEPTKYDLTAIAQRIDAIRDLIRPLKPRDRLLLLNAVLRSELDHYRARAARYGVERA